MRAITRRFLTGFATAGAALAVAAGLAVASPAAASAAPVLCSSQDNPNLILVDGTAACGASVTGDGVARSFASESGTAVAVADGNGAAYSLATGYGTALGGAIGSGTLYSAALGGGLVTAGVADGATAVALAGWGGGVSVTPTDASCFGPLTFGWVLTNGQFCLAGLEN